MGSEIKIGDLVWAKMKGFSPWPARVIQPRSTGNSRKGQYWVYFFGSADHGWVDKKSVSSYEQHKNKFVNSSKATKFKEAIAEIEEYIAKIKEDPNYQWQHKEVTVEENEVENIDDQFNKLVTPVKKTKKDDSNYTPGSAEQNNEEKKTEKVSNKRQSSDNERPSLPIKRSKRRSVSPPIVSEENGVSEVARTDVGTALLNRPAVLDRPESPVVDLCNLSELLKTKDISASSKSFGFLGIGVMGSGIVKNLINSGHKVNLWSRNPKKCEEIKEQADKIKVGLVDTYIAPCDVMQYSDIIFSCVADPRSARENVIGNCGVVAEAADGDALNGKGYVEMTGIDPQTSQDICEIIRSKGGRYLEAQVQGSKTEADEGSLVILAAGDKSLFLDCQSCFKAMGKTSFFLGDVGYATKTNLILQLIKGISLVGLAEGLALADRCGISSKDIINIFNSTNLSCSYLTNKAELIVNKDFNHVEQALQHVQKDMKLALDLSDQLKQPLLMASTANEVYKHARRLGYDGHDAACIYMRTRH